MSLSQQPIITPPQEGDKTLTDYSGILQRLFSQLFQAAHVHVGKNGVITANPTPAQGSAGDILLGVVSGTAYLFFKVDSTTWYKISGTKV